MKEKVKLVEKYNLWNGNTFPMGYVRESYIEKIYGFLGNKLVKVLVGQRRCGKSFILRQIAMKLVESGVSGNNILYLNREFIDFDFLQNYRDLDEFVKAYVEEIKPSGKIYLFIDEIQNIDEWERFVNSYSQDFTADYELVITGSNSKMLSGELSTLLSGRYVEFEIFPFSYSEYLGFYNLENNRQNYLEYLKSSGLPEMFNLDNEYFKTNYVESLKDTVLLRDIIQRYKIKNPKLLEDIFVFIAMNASNMISITNVVNYFKSKKRETTYDTIANYIGYLEDAFLIHKVERYDIKGKDTISGNCKYYLNDLAFCNYLYKGFGYGVGFKLENLVYLDLKRSGYKVFVGNIKSKEIDFVAVKNEDVKYVQCTYMLIDGSTIEREYSALETISDNYEKVVVSLDDEPLPNRNGIKNEVAWKVVNNL